MDVKNRAANIGVGISDSSKIHTFSRTTGNLPSVSIAVVIANIGMII